MIPQIDTCLLYVDLLWEIFQTNKQQVAKAYKKTSDLHVGKDNNCNKIISQGIPVMRLSVIFQSVVKWQLSRPQNKQTKN